MCVFFFFQAEDGIRDLVRSRGLGDVYKRQLVGREGAELDAVGGRTVEGDGRRDNAAIRQRRNHRACGVHRPEGRRRGRRAGRRACLLYTSPSPRDRTRSRMPSSA